MCGAVIRSNNEIVPQERYQITIQKVRLLKPETITVDLCKECFEAICDINRKKNEELEKKRR
jgi:sulfur relay (sulfurtransferase) complex TusBCD TusD component (DsrE family)